MPEKTIEELQKKLSEAEHRAESSSLAASHARVAEKVAHDSWQDQLKESDRLRKELDAQKTINAELHKGTCKGYREIVEELRKLQHIKGMAEAEIAPTPRPDQSRNEGHHQQRLVKPEVAGVVARPSEYPWHWVKYSPTVMEEPVYHLADDEGRFRCTRRIIFTEVFNEEPNDTRRMCLRCKAFFYADRSTGSA